MIPVANIDLKLIPSERKVAVSCGEFFLLPLFIYVQIKRELKMDDNAPSLLSNCFLINGGSSKTSSPRVRLSFAITDQSGISEMMISNNRNFRSKIGQVVDWEPFSPLKGWRINPHPGEKTVWAKFRDLANNETEAFSSSIDLVPPPGMVYILRNDRGLLTGSTFGEEV